MAEHTFCAICGGPFHLPSSLMAIGNNSSSSVDANLIAWVQSLRILGRNLDKGTAAYISGQGTLNAPLNLVLVSAGSDANFPFPTRRTETQTSSDGSGMIAETFTFSAYFDWDSMGGGHEYTAPFPVHGSCWRVLEKAWEMRHLPPSLPDDRKVDVEAMRMAMQALSNGRSCCLGGMRYFELATKGGRAHRHLDEDDGNEVKSLMPFFLDPMAAVEVDLFDPRLATDAHTPLPSAEITEDTAFSFLPTELLYQTLNHLDPGALLNLLEASPNLASRLDALFWRRRLQVDMPYLWELNARLCNLDFEDLTRVLWNRLYNLLWTCSYPAHEENLHSTKCDGKGLESIASRRRIWDCARQLLDRC